MKTFAFTYCEKYRMYAHMENAPIKLHFDYVFKDVPSSPFGRHMKLAHLTKSSPTLCLKEMRIFVSALRIRG